MWRIRPSDSRTRIKVLCFSLFGDRVGKKVQEYVQQVKKVYTGKVRVWAIDSKVGCKVGGVEKKRSDCEVVV